MEDSGVCESEWDVFLFFTQFVHEHVSYTWLNLNLLFVCRWLLRCWASTAVRTTQEQRVLYSGGMEELPAEKLSIYMWLLWYEQQISVWKRWTSLQNGSQNRQCILIAARMHFIRVRFRSQIQHCAKAKKKQKVKCWGAGVVTSHT